MATSALNHRLLPHRLLTPPPPLPPSPSPSLVIIRPLGAERRFRPSFLPLLSTYNNHSSRIASCLSSSSPQRTRLKSSNRLFVSGLSFRTTEESLRNAFNKFGELIQVNLVMDKLANRPRGFAFVSYATEEESKKAIEGMHGKFLDGRVIFVEIAKSRAELRQELNQNPRQD